MAVLDLEAVAALVHELCVEGQILLAPTAIELHGVEAVPHEGAYVTLVIDAPLDPFSACTAVLVKTHFDALVMAVLYQPLQGGKLVIDRGSTIEVVLRVIHSLSATLPALVDANALEAHIKQRYPVRRVL